MTDIEFAELGYYKPGFLHLKINTQVSLENLNDLLENEKEIFSTFLHEYIHFLQNVTTTSGLYYSSYYIQYLKDIVWNIKETEGEKFKVPLQITNKFNKLSQIELHRIYIGDTQNFTQYTIYQGYDFTENQISSIDGTVINPKKFIVHYIDTSDRNFKKYHFGLYAIKEFIAHTIQNQFIEVDHPDIPYLIVDQMLCKEIPSIADRLDLKLALCEGSLMSLHPAQFLFETVEKLKICKSFPNDAKSMYDFVHDNVALDGPLGKFSVIELFDYFIDDVIYNYSDALKSEIFKNELIWLIHVIKEGKKLRDSNPLYILDLITSEKKISDTFVNVMQKLGTPFFTNDAQYGGFIPPRDLEKIPDQTYILAAVAEVISVIFGQRGCSLYSFCSKEQTKHITSEHCLSEPWKKMNDKELCPFCQLWKTWGIYNKTPSKI